MNRDDDDRVADEAIARGFIDPQETLDPDGTAFTEREHTCWHGEPYGRCPVCDDYPGDPGPDDGAHP